MLNLSQIAAPTLLVDRRKARHHIQRMAKKAMDSGVVYRPHFKSHQSRAVGRWYRELGVQAITVSSLSMARYFAEDGWDDITVAFPLNIREMALVNELAGKIRLNLVVESVDAVEALEAGLNTPVRVLIKVDTGYHRTGVKAEAVVKMDAILQSIANSPYQHFTGFLAHAGHSYGAKTHADIEAIYHQGADLLQMLKARYVGQFPDLMLSYGDTPTCSVLNHFPKVDELRPGNLIFYDLAQYYIGSCELKDIAVAMACPVVAIHPDDQKIVLYGGAVHLSKDRVTTGEGRTIFGLVVRLEENGWSDPVPDCWVSGLSQEHGIVHASDELLNKVRVGELLGVLPAHSCLAANLMRGFMTVDGEYLEAGFELSRA